MSEKKLFFFDVDGTLVDSATHTIPQSTSLALQKLRDKGHLLCISTGRSLQSLMDAGFQSIIDWDYFLCNNGQAIYDHEFHCIHMIPIPQTAVKACLEKAKELHAPFMLMCEKNSLLTMEPDENVIVSANFFHEKIPPVMPYDGSPVIMMMAYGPSGYDYHDYADIEDVTFIEGQSNYSDIVLKGFHKHKGITYLLKDLNRNDYIAFGDSMNDIEMLQNADIGIAMGNADERIKEVADYVTTAVHEDGILHALKHFTFI